MIKKILFLIPLLLLASGHARAACSYTTVSATITDPNGVPYAYANVSADLVPSTSGNPVCSGQAFSGHIPAQADGTGTFTMQVPPNASIVPASTQWQFTVGITPGVAPPFGKGPQSFVVTVTISGASQSLTSTLSTAAPALTVTFTSSGSSAFSALTSGTNTTAAMIVGTGASLAVSGSGTIAATTAAALAALPTPCSAGNAPTGILANGNSTGCQAVGGSGAFSALTSGTNTTAAMLVGTGASLAASGSGTLTATAAPLAGITGLGTGVATFLATPSSANLATAVTGATGSGALMFGTNPTIAGATITAAFTGTGAYVPVSLLNSGTAATSSTFWRGDGTWATPAGSISGLTTGFLPKAGSATTIANSLCDEGITTANTLTCTDTAGITAPLFHSDGAGAGGLVMTASTAQGHAMASTVTLEAPATATAYEITLPTAAATGVVEWTNTSNVVAQSIVATTGTGSVMQAASPTTTGTLTAAIIDASGASSFTAAPTASTPSLQDNTTTCFSGGSTTTNTPTFYLNQSTTAPTTWSASCTVFGINAPAGTLGNIIDLHTNGGAGLFSISGAGIVKGSTFQATGFQWTTAHVLMSSTAPVIGTCGTSPSIVANNGTNAFVVNVGTGGTVSTCTVTMPTATVGWSCMVSPNGAPQAAAVTYSAPTSATVITLTNYTLSTGIALPWASGAAFNVNCQGY